MLIVHPLQLGPTLRGLDESIQRLQSTAHQQAGFNDRASATLQQLAMDLRAAQARIIILMII